MVAARHTLSPQTVSRHHSTPFSRIRGGVAKPNLRNKTIIECGFKVRKDVQCSLGQLFDAATQSPGIVAKLHTGTPGAMHPAVARLKAQDQQDFPLLQPDRAYCGPRLTPVKETPQSSGRCSLFLRKRLQADLDDLAKELDVVKLQSATKLQRPGGDGMDISPRR